MVVSPMMKNKMKPLYIVCDWDVALNQLNKFSDEAENVLYIFRMRQNGKYDMIMRAKVNETTSRVLVKECFNGIFDYEDDKVHGWSYSTIIPDHVKTVNDIYKLYYSDEEILNEYFWLFLA